MTVDIAAQQAALLQAAVLGLAAGLLYDCLLYTSPSPRDS